MWQWLIFPWESSSRGKEVVPFQKLANVWVPIARDFASEFIPICSNLGWFRHAVPHTFWSLHSFLREFQQASSSYTVRIACVDVGSKGPQPKTGAKWSVSTWQIDDKQLRGYLSELRPVTIVFVNLVFKDQDKPEIIGAAIQDASVHINSVLRDFRGQINKVFMFDKVSVNWGVGSCQQFNVIIWPGTLVRKGIDTFNLEALVFIYIEYYSFYGECGIIAVQVLFSTFSLCELISSSWPLWEVGALIIISILQMRLLRQRWGFWDKKSLSLAHSHPASKWWARIPAQVMHLPSLPLTSPAYSASPSGSGSGVL